MAIKTIPLREIEERTEDMYEATLVMAKRARQIIGDRAAEEKMEVYEEELPLLGEPQLSEDYEEKEKATTVAVEEFLKEELQWSYPEPDEE
ncbi:MAG: DNA-directed RNA polymerase subunit omega [Candidatus Marinimicrobia bacterium]|jgi:hypothetical protein|nr:hypothetical protein [Candidatus Neomarinimicrobiota bacterium]MDP6456112.1 DNA-directed RNA polymerase subunit omega [Candidatus Neomarinimicrobiota bacterium]MDP6592896.1 DNA-directed RNA polymerase subunit omega [Candidatus Neomarinimicrobiota bacterium]MDP6836169.1 DNA-directed RNA polymerase subunit omega [Candidatus Neomarinimicrobiota bacterium]MDP6966884.1 DNA-directed RNA polymerase subunit omega [Candidatus Neomarinimicrobiota bacterium]|tara:strand:- start:16134 stop:16406 length:273 start_codon:yes stop_codon:yes gene_type:complete